jgi:acyl-CoA synthetase (AMP-forming)/AMP-acid ligase II
VADTRREFDVADILDGLPERLHDTMVRGVAETPDHPALIEDDRTWSYRQLADNVAQVAVSLLAMGIRPGDRMMVISENSIGLAALLLAASKINAWAIVVNPRLSPRELDQIRDHSGSRRMFFTAGVSAEAANHAQRVGAEIGRIGPLENIGISALNEATLPEPVEVSAAKQVAVLIYTSGTTGTPKGSC